ncbi:MAG TPA: leucyl/phenylalanyl-tRNA--protein transferase [Rhizomicrobium sp.]|jgi:leucyl/phenylalanyl-tRNA--protein transferase|nr:leucyl/phenylalanyl-tRNA--protein transferase [Rhizomicrobium sp.]
MPTVPELDVDLLLRAYAHGIFPMARHRNDDEIYFVSPEERGIIPLETFHVPRRLARTVRSDRFVVRIDSAFHDVITTCANAAPGREESWINAQILSLYTQLHRLGRAHSVECWREGGLAGGLYGVSMGGAFFGESMFSRERDASKVALVHLVARLKAGGFSLLDAQFLTDHLAQFGAVAVPRQRYLELLARALSKAADFRCAERYCPDPSGSSGAASLAPESGEVAFTGAVDATTGATWPGWFVLQLITQTS